MYPSPASEVSTDSSLTEASTLSGCGHSHAVALYARGCVYATHVALALVASGQDARRTTQTADELLWPLDSADADDVRDFLAGAHAAFEALAGSEPKGFVEQASAAREMQCANCRVQPFENPPI